MGEIWICTMTPSDNCSAIQNLKWCLNCVIKYLYCGSSPFPKRYFEISSQMTTKIFFTSTQKRWPWEKKSGLHVAEYCDAVKAQLSCKAMLQKGKTQPHIPADYRSDGVANFLSQVQLLSRRRSNCVANFMSRHKNTNFAQNPDRCSTPMKKKNSSFHSFGPSHLNGILLTTFLSSNHRLSSHFFASNSKAKAQFFNSMLLLSKLTATWLINMTCSPEKIYTW